VTTLLRYLSVNLVPLTVALAVPTGTYLAVRRRLTGRVTSSEATDLWAESREIRREQREVERQLRAENLVLHEEIAQLRRAVAEAALAREDCLKRLEQATLRMPGPPG
jgi:hypothetical protein